MERQTIESRYSSVPKVQLVLADLFPRNRFPQFFSSNKKGFDVDMRMDKISFLAPRPLTEDELDYMKVQPQVEME